MKSLHAIKRDIAHTVITAALQAIENAGFPCTAADDGSYLVAERYRFFPANGFWRSLDSTLFGYGPRTLIADARIGDAVRHFTFVPAVTETPAGRDSGEILRSPNTDHKGPDNSAESAGVPTSSKLARATL